MGIRTSFRNSHSMFWVKIIVHIRNCTLEFSGKRWQGVGGGGGLVWTFEINLFWVYLKITDMCKSVKKTKNFFYAFLEGKNIFWKNIDIITYKYNIRCFMIFLKHFTHGGQRGDGEVIFFRFYYCKLSFATEE